MSFLKKHKSLVLGVASAFSFAAAPALPQTTIENPASQAEDEQNLKLLLDLQKNHQSIIADASTDYSGKLKAIEEKYTAYAQRNLNLDVRMSILDPVKFEVGSAIGLPPDMTAQTLLLQRGVRPFPELTRIVASAMTTMPNLNIDDGVYRTKPTAIFFDSANGSATNCIVIPATEENTGADENIPDLENDKRVTFQNWHEAWHCIDTLYYRRKFSPETYSKLEIKGEAFTKVLLDNPDCLAAFSALHMSEVFADVAAVGDMVRAGDDLTVLNKIASWRLSKPLDIAHASQPALLKLGELIAEDIDAFRELPDKSALLIYRRITDEYGLSPERIRIKIGRDGFYKTNPSVPSSPFQMHDIEVTALYDAYKIRKIDNNNALSFSLMDITSSHPYNERRKAEVERILQDWKPIEDIKSRARKSGAVITPETIIKSYLDLRQELQAQKTADPGNSDLYNRKLVLLKADFVTDTRALNYTGMRKNGPR